MAGKWHCNSKFNSPDQPQPGDAGFDHWMATQNNAAPSHANPNNFVRNGKEVGPLQGYSCQIVAQEGINWITDHQKSKPEQPFFFYMAFHEPHEPIASPEEIIATYRSVAVSEKEATYFANVDNMDRAVGKLLRALKDLAINKNTLIVFTSDNGPETLNRYRTADHSWGRPDPLRSMKLWTTEAGFRVAGIMRWPAEIKPGQTVNQPVSSLDFLPTFCELADIKPPASLKLDGTSFLPALKNKTIPRKTPLVWAYYNAINDHRVAMRSANWKVLAKVDLPKLQNVYSGNIDQVRAASLSDIEIYDLKKDIKEANDLSGKNQKLLNDLTRELNRNYSELLENSHIWNSEDK
jgi:arylsulfatase A